MNAPWELNTSKIIMAIISYSELVLPLLFSADRKIKVRNSRWPGTVFLHSISIAN